MNKQNKIIWLKAQCPVCNKTFEYPEGGYQPKTCAKFDCLFQFNHYPRKYGMTVMQQLDECRKRAKI